MHLDKQIGHIGSELRVLVGHSHSSIALRTYHSPEKKKYYEHAVGLIRKYKPHLYCADAKMSLLETRDCMRAAWEASADVTGPAPKISGAAWFPYLFVEPELEAVKFTNIPREGLGVDSLEMFYITYGNSPTAQAARVSPFIDGSYINSSLLHAEDSPAWNAEYVKEGKDLKRVLLKFSPKAGYPGPTFPEISTISYRSYTKGSAHKFSRTSHRCMPDPQT